jgi:membrane protease YdiL (CAAX protease family)
MVAWVNVIVALAGLGLVAWVTHRWPVSTNPLLAHLIGLAAIVVIAIGVLVVAVWGEGYTWSDLGFGRLDGWTPVIAMLLTAFFVLIFGPFAYWLVGRLGVGDFSAGLSATRQLPVVYLVLTIVVVASVEEILFRGYAIVRLTDLTGSIAAAALISIVAFGLVHVPMWGWGPALTTVLSGAVLTAVYLWRPDIVALMLAHIATDVYGLIIAVRMTESSSR